MTPYIMYEARAAIDDWSLHRESCTLCKGGRPSCCPDGTMFLAQLRIATQALHEDRERLRDQRRKSAN